MAKTDLTNPIYHDDNAAREHLESVLWPDGPSCPRCGVMSDRITKLQGKSTRPGVYKCKDCRKPFIPFPYQIDFAMYGNDVMDLTSAGLRSM
jgi:hypothetical protein